VGGRHWPPHGSRFEEARVWPVPPTRAPSPVLASGMYQACLGDNPVDLIGESGAMVAQVHVFDPKNVLIADGFEERRRAVAVWRRYFVHQLRDVTHGVPAELGKLRHGNTLVFSHV